MVSELNEAPEADARVERHERERHIAGNGPAGNGSGPVLTDDDSPEAVAERQAERARVEAQRNADDLADAVRNDENARARITGREDPEPYEFETLTCTYDNRLVTLVDNAGTCPVCGSVYEGSFTRTPGEAEVTKARGLREEREAREASEADADHPSETVEDRQEREARQERERIASESQDAAFDGTPPANGENGDSEQGDSPSSEPPPEARASRDPLTEEERANREGGSDHGETTHAQ